MNRFSQSSSGFDDCDDTKDGGVGEGKALDGVGDDHDKGDNE